MTGEPVDSEPTKRQWLGYWSMIVQQTQNAFNDKMAQFLLVPLAGAISFLIPIWPGVGVGVESVAGIMIALPFVLFAPLAGWLSDRFSKRDVMLGTAIAQLVILAWICLAVWVENMWMALFGFFGLAIQSAFFGPAKMGINKELVGSRHLGFATGIQQMTTMLAILAGQIAAGWWYDLRWAQLGGVRERAWEAASLPLFVLLVCAGPALLLAWIIPRVPAQSDAKFTRRIAFSHFTHLGELWRHAGLRRAACGVAFFWGIAAFINLWSVKLAKFMTAGGEGFGTLSSGYMAAASLGMALGFGFAAYLLRRRIELGWVPFGGLLMAVMCMVVMALPFGGWAFLVSLGVLAFSSALFLAPLNAWMLDHYPADKRGEFQAAVNLLDCLAGILSVLIIELFFLVGRAAGLGDGTVMRVQMVFASLACAVATWGMIRMLPADFLRLLSLSLMRITSRVRMAHAERMPESGGVLLLPNHVSFLDAFLVAQACPRPVRFVMDEIYASSRSINWFTRIFGTVLIRRDQPLEAIRRVIDALQQGEVVCLFPEGQLTRTGGLSPLQRGFELIARKAGHPVVPCWLDGVWGSVASFERNRFFSKLPHRGKLQVTVGFGIPLEGAEIDRCHLRNAMLKVSAEAIERRFASSNWNRKGAPCGGILSEMFEAAGEARERAAWINGHQIRMVNALQPATAIHVWRNDPILHDLHGLLVGFAAFARAKVRIEDKILPKSGQVWVGSDGLREILVDRGSGSGIQFFDFSSDAVECLDVSGVEHFPCLALDGRVISMSMRDPAEVPEGFDPQHGNKPGSYGRLLPGWWIEREEESGDLHVYGPAAPWEGLRLPKGCELDEEGFVVSAQG